MVTAELPSHLPPVSSQPLCCQEITGKVAQVRSLSGEPRLLSSTKLVGKAVKMRSPSSDDNHYEA